MIHITSRLRALNDEAAQEAADKIEQLERSLKDTSQVEYAQKKQIERLRAALMRLGNEVRATMSVAEMAVRESAGNTNYQCLMDAESEARAALGDR